MKKEALVFLDFSHIRMELRKFGEPARTHRFAFEQFHQEFGHRFRLAPGSLLVRSAPPEGVNSDLLQSDIEYLKSVGYKDVALPLRARRIECHGCSRSWSVYSEKTVDAKLITALFTAAIHGQQSQEIVLVSGDGDFLEAVQVIRELGAAVHVFGFKNSTNKYIKRSGIPYHTLDRFVERL